MCANPVIDYIHEKYERKGANFHFRCKHISKALNITSQLVAVRVAQAIKRGEPIVIARDSDHNEKLYRTQYKEKK